MEAEYFPPLAGQMVRVGEESGTLPDMLIKVADRLDWESTQLTKRLLTIAEPLLIIVMGLVIGGMVIAVLVGIMSVNSMPL